MSASSSSRSLTSAFKRLKLSPSSSAVQRQTRHIHQSSQRATPAPTNSVSAQITNPSVEETFASLRLPKAVQATYLAPLKRQAPEGATKSAALQLRSYSVRNLEVFADFALRAAYFLNLPATGPRPLRRITQRWTLPRSNFVHKKSQETFERITMQRLIEIHGGHPETVAIWLAFLKKHQYYGVGMKAHVYEHGSVDTGKDLDAEAVKIKQLLADGSDGTYETFAGEKRGNSSQYVFKEPFKGSWGGLASSTGTSTLGGGNSRLSIPAIKRAGDEALGVTEEAGPSGAVEQTEALEQHPEKSQ